MERSELHQAAGLRDGRSSLRDETPRRAQAPSAARTSPKTAQTKSGILQPQRWARKPTVRKARPTPRLPDPLWMPMASSSSRPDPARDLEIQAMTMG